MLSLAALCVAGFLLLGRLVGGSIYRAEATELYAVLDRWLEAGRPEGVALTKFMQGRRPDLIATNRTLKVDGSVYVTYFALTNPNANAGVATFLITTNGQLIAIDKRGRARLASLKDRL